MLDEREQLALDALLVSQLRSCNETVPSHLPPLLESETAALDGLGTDFVDRLLADAITPPQYEMLDHNLAAAGEAFGMNRAEAVDDETRKEIDRKRQEIIDEIKRQESEDGGSTG